MDVRKYDSLEIGEVFPRDLLDDLGNVVLTAGEAVSRELIKKLAELGFEKVFLASEPTRPTHYASNDLQTLRNLFDDAPSLLENVADRLLSGEDVPSEEIDQTTDQCLASIASDSCAVLSTAMTSAEDLETVFQRNLRLSAIAMVAAREFGCSPADCKAIGRAGLLCDISIPADAPKLYQIPQDTTAYDRALSDHLQHPLNSAELLRERIPGIAQLELIIVTQSHEQCDGKGFPRGLRKRYLHPLARLLNVVDAFLTLTDSADPEGQIVPSDALAYLVLHSLYGSFDTDCVRALISAAAIYPIGTDVILENAKTGKVVRSAGSEYLDPIIQIDGSDELLELGRSDDRILSPMVDATRNRLTKDKLHMNLWSRAA